MAFIFQFSYSWYLLFFGFLISWLTITIIRRKHITRKEAKEQFILGFFGLFSLILMEIFATSMNLWYYVPQNWPVILWPTYYVAVLFGYQLLRVVESIFLK